MSDWTADALLPGFEARTLEFPDDYDGRVVATLVRLPAGDAPRGAVLYVHGFVDYFFQRHMAERFAALAGRAFPFLNDPTALSIEALTGLTDSLRAP